MFLTTYTKNKSTFCKQMTTFFKREILGVKLDDYVEDYDW